MALNGKIGKFSTSRVAPIDKIRSPTPLTFANAAKCQTVVQIGVFFDGTGNNRERDEAKLGHSNVARLYKVYPTALSEGFFSIYVPGLGTPFPQIGEAADSLLDAPLGSAFARGGDSRIIYAMLQVFNAISRSYLSKYMFSADLTKALCQRASPSKNERKLLEKEALLDSLVNIGGSAVRRQFFKASAEILQEELRTKKTPKIMECVLDVFGFSRGATEARVFCSWLLDVLPQRKLAGVPIRIRFLGLMDTVASVGLWEGVKNSALNQTGGHAVWANPESMRILPEVENCLHMVAMHEFRKNFPLDSVSVNGVLPPNCIEFAYPGSHSDVGGGYCPNELGVSFSKTLSEGDALKLSQIPLNHMYECACAAGVPLAERGLAGEAVNGFAIHERVHHAFARFLDLSTQTPRSMGDWALPYLVWRWQIRNEYERTSQFTNSNAEERSYLLASNREFCFGDELIRLSNDSKRMKERMKTQRQRSYGNRDANYVDVDVLSQQLEPEAPQLWSRVVAEGQIVQELAAFFDGFVHDSLAGFRKQFVEHTGYWRYRRVFLGSAVPCTG